MRRVAVLAAALCQLWWGGGPDRLRAEEPFPPLYTDVEYFLRAMAQARWQPVSRAVTGLTVPHHLLAADLIADAFEGLKHQRYRRVILLSPDHFSRSATPFAVTLRDFQTVFGPVRTDTEAVSRLLGDPLVSVSQLFSHEHGVQALLPFVARHFPEARLVAVAIHPRARREEWDSLARSLAPLLTPDSLVLQSTDFSHYLPRAAADARDQETLRLLSGGDPDAVLQLSAPAHLDCRGAMYLQLRLQREVFQARPTVMAHKNSQDYSAAPLKETTSYFIQYYSREPLAVPGTETWFFAGDTFFGRSLGRVLADPGKREALTRTILGLTRGAPLVVNLEGVMRETCPPEPHPYKLCMEAALTLDLLKKFNVRVVSVANNHTHDYHKEGFEDMTRRLRAEGLRVLGPGDLEDLGPFRLLALTDVDNHPRPRSECLTEKDLTILQQTPRDKPVCVFIHWGREFAAGPGPREELLADRLTRLGVELIIGSHPHRAGELTATPRALQVFSLGNFIFDQKRPEASGALLEVNFFPSGGYFVRLQPLGNLYTSMFGGGGGQGPQAPAPSPGPSPP
jgi:AmmeMemoRadiSam system protein B